MKKLFIVLMMTAFLGGCRTPSGYYRVVHVDVYSTHGGHWHEVAPGEWRPRRKVVIVKKRRRGKRVRIRHRHRDQRRHRHFYRHR